MGKTIDEAYDLVEEMIANNYQWGLDHSAQRKTAGVYEVEAITNRIA